MVHPIKDVSEFTSRLKDAKDKLVVIKFVAPWCRMCTVSDAELDGMAEQMKDVVFMKVNVDDCESIAHKYCVSKIPTVVLVKNGKPRDSLIGSKFMPSLKEVVEKHSNSSN